MNDNGAVLAQAVAYHNHSLNAKDNLSIFDIFDEHDSHYGAVVVWRGCLLIRRSVVYYWLPQST